MAQVELAGARVGGFQVGGRAVRRGRVSGGRRAAAWCRFPGPAGLAGRRGWPGDGGGCRPGGAGRAPRRRRRTGPIQRAGGGGQLRAVAVGLARERSGRRGATARCGAVGGGVHERRWPSRARRRAGSSRGRSRGGRPDRRTSHRDGGRSWKASAMTWLRTSRSAAPAGPRGRHVTACQPRPALGRLISASRRWPG